MTIIKITTMATTFLMEPFLDIPISTLSFVTGSNLCEGHRDTLAQMVSPNVYKGFVPNIYRVYTSRHESFLICFTEQDGKIILVKESVKKLKDVLNCYESDEVIIKYVEDNIWMTIIRNFGGVNYLFEKCMIQEEN